MAAEVRSVEVRQAGAAEGKTAEVQASAELQALAGAAAEVRSVEVRQALAEGETAEGEMAEVQASAEMQGAAAVVRQAGTAAEGKTAEVRSAVVRQAGAEGKTAEGGHSSRIQSAHPRCPPRQTPHGCPTRG